LPQAFQRFSAGAVLFIELGLPWLIWLPRRPKLAAFAGFILLQLLIGLTGNYGFFNLLTVGLCLFLLDDSVLGRRPPASLPHGRLGALAAAAIFFLGGVQLLELLARRRAAFLLPVERAAAPFRSVNNYGLFAVMTTTRVEIEIEGSADGRTWKAYGFKWKPGPLDRRPGFVAPLQPRLDWQMWFAALGSLRGNPWLMNLLGRLLQGSPDVLGLMAENPFPDGPPRYVRALAYRYRFTGGKEGGWWKRELLGPYSPVVALNAGARS
jgi:lipase maturation factor 1